MIEYLEKSVTLEEYRTATELFNRILDNGIDTEKAVAMIYRSGRKREQDNQKEIRARRKAYYKELNLNAQNIDSQPMAINEGSN